LTALSGHGLPVTGAEGGYRARVLPSPLASSLAPSGLNAADVVLTPRIDRELRGRGRDYVRVVVVAAVVADDVAEALDLAWWAFREAAGDDLAGWDTAAAAAEVQPADA
jgi:hypothetical protein